MTSAPPLPPDPPRLFGDDDALGQALREARADLPAKEQLGDLAARLGPLLPPIGPGGPGDGGFGAGGEGLSAPPVPPVATLPPEALGPLAPLPLAPLVSGKVAAVLVAASVAIGAPFAYQATRPAPARVEVSSNSTSNWSIPAPVEPVRIATTSIVPAVSAAPSARAATSVRVTSPSGVGNEPASEDAAPQETEGQLLRRAHDALASDPLRALALTDDHVRKFPGGMLGQERELVAIEALVKLGRVGQARVRGGSFLQRFPTSAHARRVRALVPGLEDIGEEK